MNYQELDKFDAVRLASAFHEAGHHWQAMQENVDLLDAVLGGMRGLRPSKDNTCTFSAHADIDARIMAAGILAEACSYAVDLDAGPTEDIDPDLFDEHVQVAVQYALLGVHSSRDHTAAIELLNSDHAWVGRTRDGLLAGFRLVQKVADVLFERGVMCRHDIDFHLHETLPYVHWKDAFEF